MFEYLTKTFKVKTLGKNAPSLRNLIQTNPYINFRKLK